MEIDMGYLVYVGKSYRSVSTKQEWRVGKIVGSEVEVYSMLDGTRATLMRISLDYFVRNFMISH
jgi:hypothetical protein